MDYSPFLAKVIGYYLCIIGAAFSLNRKEYKSVMQEILTNEGLLLFTSIFGLVLGLLLVLSHNIWIMGWQTSVTLIGWLALFKSLLRLLFPSKANLLAKQMIQGSGYQIAISLNFFLGLIYLYFGYFN